MVPKTASIIIPTSNRKLSLRYTLLSLVHQSYPAGQFEVILVDNFSTDGTREMVQSMDLPYRVRLLSVPKEKPFESSRIRNCGIRAATGDVLIFLDSDMIVPRRFVEHHMAFHQYAPGLAVLGKMIYLESNDALSDSVVLSNFKASDLGRGRVAGDTVQRFLDFCGNLPQYLRAWDFCIGANFSVARASVDRIGMFDESMDGDLPAAADIAYGLQMHSGGVRLVYGRAAIGFHQRNHALSLAEDPAYFERRRNSVWARERYVNERWLSGVELEEVEEHISAKRELNRVIGDFHAKYTLQVETGRLGRLTTLNSHALKTGISVFLMSDSDAAALSRALTALSQQDCPPEDFEVIVLDPEADVDEMADDYSTVAHIVVQSAHVPYTLRYFPAGTVQHHQRLEEIRKQYLPGGGLAEQAGLTLLALEEATYTRHIQRLLLEKPLAEISITLKSSKMDLDPGLLSRIVTELRQCNPGEHSPNTKAFARKVC